MHQLWRQSPVVPFLLALMSGIIVWDTYQLPIPAALLGGCLLIALAALYAVRISIVGLYLSLISAFFIGSLLVVLHQDTVHLPVDAQDYYARVASRGRESAKAVSAELSLFDKKSETELQSGQTRIAAIFLKKNGAAVNVQVGEIIRFRARMQPISPEDAFTRAQKRKGIHHKAFITEYETLGAGSAPIWQRAREWMRSAVMHPEHIEHHVLVKGICLGEKSGFDKESLLLYQRAGYMHLLAVSGMHIGIIASLLGYLFLVWGKTRRTRVAARIAAVVILWFYVAMIGFAPSAVRAALMFSLFFIVDISERMPNRYNVLAIAALSMLVFSPMLVFDIGFQLSFAAMVGIFAALRVHKEYVRHPNSVSKFFSEAFTVGLGAQLGTLPFCLHYFGYYPTYSLIFGVGAGFIVFVIMALVMLSAAAFFANMHGYIGYAIDVFGSLLEHSAYYSNSLPYSGVYFKISLPTAVMLAAVIASLLLWCEYSLAQRKEKMFSGMAS